MSADPWVAGASYEPFMGRWSRLVAPRFLDWLARPPGLRWVDVGCGTGALSHAIAERASPASVLGVDPSPDFVAFAASRAVDDRCSFRVGTADDLPSGGADVVASGLVLNFVPDPGAAVGSMVAAASGGAVASYIWDYVGGMQMLSTFWDAAVALDASAGPMHEAVRFPGWGPERLAGLVAAAGAGEVTTASLTVTSTYADGDALWEPLLGGTGPAPGYVAGLDADHRDALRERWIAGLPVAADGSIALTATAYAVQGRA